MSTLTSQLNNALGAMDLVKVNEVMTNFEKMFDNLDINAELMDKAMDNINAGTYQEKDVNGLIDQVTAEFGLKTLDELADVSNKQVKIGEGQEKVGTNQVANPHLNNY